MYLLIRGKSDSDSTKILKQSIYSSPVLWAKALGEAPAGIP